MSELIQADRQVARKRQYAVTMEDEAGNIEKYLTFNVAGKSFGANINCIKEIIEHGRFTRVPLSQSNIRGVINLRGHVVPVVDLAKRLGFESQPVNKRTCIIIVEITDGHESVDIGYVVDAVDEVIDLHVNDVEPAPEFGLDVRHDFIAGMGKLPSDEFIKLLDLDTVLSVQELSEVPRAQSGDA